MVNRNLSILWDLNWQNDDDKLFKNINSLFKISQNVEKNNPSFGRG